MALIILECLLLLLLLYIIIKNTIWKRFHKEVYLMKKLLTITSLVALGGALALGAISAVTANDKEVSEVNADSYQTYVPLRDGWIDNTDGSAVTNLNDAIRARNDRFWNGGTGWDSQERSFNALDEFVDTIHRANGGEGWRGAYRTPELVLHDNDHRYISFLFGGGGDDIFINIFQVSGEAGSGDRVTGIRTALDETGYYSNEQGINPNHLNAPISCNMVLKYVELPNQIQPGDRFLIYVRDGRTGGYGGFTFGDVHINQTLEDCARSFSAHKAQMKRNEYISDWTEAANEYVLNYYANDSYYSALRTAEAALTDANDDFEVNNRLSKWCYDQDNSRLENGDLANINFDGIYSDKDYKWGGYFYDNNGLMPVNKTGNRFLTGEPNDIDSFNCGLPESAKYRLISPEFTLSGTGLISAKIGGHYAKLSLLDDEFNVLLSTGNNPSFVDADMTNIISSGARMCTMTRTYLDCSEYIGDRVHIAIEDSQTGGGWNLAYFDEIVTRYDSLPSFKLDVIHQTHPNSEEVDNGVVMDKLVVGTSYNANFKAAYDFAQSYYSTVRTSAKSFSACGDNRTAAKTALETAYGDLSVAAKAVVDASEDFHYGDIKGSYEGDYWLAAVNKQWTIGESMAAILSGDYPAPSSVAFSFGQESNGTTTIVVVLSIALITVLTFTVIIYLKKRKLQ